MNTALAEIIRLLAAAAVAEYVTEIEADDHNEHDEEEVEAA